MRFLRPGSGADDLQGEYWYSRDSPTIREQITSAGIAADERKTGMTDLSGMTTGVVLSGGGAKGAYQVGMFRALEEAGLSRDPEHLLLAGTSIGALNALSYALYGSDGVKKLLGALGDAVNAMKPAAKGETDVSTEGSGADQETAGDSTGREGNTSCAGNNDGRDFAGQVLAFAKQFFPDSALKENRISVQAGCYSRKENGPVLFRLNEEKPADQRLLVIASACLPGIAPAVPYGGDFLSDGGVVPEGSPAGARGDKIPADAFLYTDLDVLVVSYLKPDDQADPEVLDALRRRDTRVIEIRPSKPLEERPHQGTLDFRREKMQEREQLGYADTKRILAQ